MLIGTTRTKDLYPSLSQMQAGLATQGLKQLRSTIVQNGRPGHGRLPEGTDFNFPEWRVPACTVLATESPGMDVKLNLAMRRLKLLYCTVIKLKGLTVGTFIPSATKKVTWITCPSTPLQMTHHVTHLPHTDVHFRKD